MLKLRQLTCLGLLVASLTNVVTLTDVQAATWHKGTPKVLRGLYQSTTPPAGNGKGPIAFSPVLRIGPKIFDLGVDNMPTIVLHKIKYYKLHGTYHIRGLWMYDNYFKKTKYFTFYLKKTGHHTLTLDRELYRRVKRIGVHG